MNLLEILIVVALLILGYIGYQIAAKWDERRTQNDDTESGKE